MKPAPFEYVAPRSIEEALSDLARFGEDARPLAGGQSLVPLLALRLARPSALVDLNRIAELAPVRIDGDTLHIGAMARQAAALANPDLAPACPLLVKALRFVGHPPTRARGTVGGSLAHGDPAAELPAALVAADAVLIARGPNDTRSIRAEDFFLGPFETALEEGELLVETRVPIAPDYRSSFLEIAPREGDFAIVSVAVRLAFEADGRCRDARVVLGAVNPDGPIRCPEVETGLVGRVLDRAAIGAAVEALPADRIEFDTWLASRSYRARAAAVLTRRAIAEAAGLEEQAA